MLNRIAILLILLSYARSGFGQTENVQIKGYFKTDSVRLGEPIDYFLIANYPRTWQVLLPDSTFNFFPFEFQKKHYSHTKTEKDISTDSVVYTLTTFEIDSMQFLALPAYVVQSTDCTIFQSQSDTVFFSHLITQLPDSLSAEQLPLRTNTSYNPVSWLFNYPLFSIIGGVILILIIIVWLVFGKKIKKHFLVKRLNKNHESFMREYDAHIEKLKTGFTVENAEKSIIVWKNYMEELLRKPYTKFTTRELKSLEQDENLYSSLATIDRAIYGRMNPNSLESFIVLREYSQTKFTKKLEELTHE